MLAIADEAARLVMKVYSRPFEVEFKGPQDPVTEADREANALICARLSEEFPGVPIVAEESPREAWGDYQNSSRVFFVDPVDGTKEFVARSGNFVVMIGLVEGDRPCHGVLNAPALNTVWGGTVGHGAFVQREGGDRQRLGLLAERPLTGSRVLCSRSHRGPLTDEVLARMEVGEVKALGSAGLKGAAVADGRADVYLAPEFAGSRWDTCAPEAILRAVGGVLTDVQGRVLDYRSERVENDGGAVAAAPQLNAAVVNALKQLIH